MKDQVKCCYCSAPLVVQTRVKGSAIIRSWKCQYCELEIKDEGDVTPEQVRQVMSVLNGQDEEDRLTCPECGSHNLSSTCLGVLRGKDNNKAACVACGWKGLAHEAGAPDGRLD